MAEATAAEAPQTLEGWYILHDVYAVDWARWRGLDEADAVGEVWGCLSPILAGEGGADFGGGEHEF